MKRNLFFVILIMIPVAFSAELPSTSENSWLKSINEDDVKGTLSQMRYSLQKWNFIDEIVFNHDLPEDIRGDLKARRKYVTENILKFFERKVSEEGRKADGNKTMVTMAKINNGLKPNASFGFSDAFKIKFRGKLLQGSGTVLLLNPYLDFNFKMDLSKGAFIEGVKKIEELDLNSTLNYSLKEDMTTFKLDKNISKEFNAGITYQNGPTTHNVGDLELKFLYSRPF